MNEFLDKYEIIDQEGKIYTVRERMMTDEAFKKEYMAKEKPND